MLLPNLLELSHIVNFRSLMLQECETDVKHLWHEPNMASVWNQQIHFYFRRLSQSVHSLVSSPEEGREQPIFLRSQVISHMCKCADRYVCGYLTWLRTLVWMSLVGRFQCPWKWVELIRQKDNRCDRTDGHMVRYSICKVVSRFNTNGV